MSIHVMFDLDAFSHAVQDNESVPQKLTSGTRVLAYASFAFLEEIAAIRKADVEFYRLLRDRYITFTYGRLVLPWNAIAIRESAAGRALERREVLLERSEYIDTVNLLQENEVDDLAEEVKQRKTRYINGMNSALAGMLEDPQLRDLGRRDIKRGFSDWFSNGESILQSWGERVFRRKDVDYRKLPHVRLILYYFFAKQYHALVSDRKYREGELYDRAYLIEATTLGNLVTDDGDLRRTANIIPNNPVKVHSRLDFF